MGKLIDFILFSFPAWSVLEKMKARRLKRKGVIDRRPEYFKINRGLQVKGKVQFLGNISINSNVMLASSGNAQIIVGSNVLIGPNVVVRASSHGMSRNEPMIFQDKTNESISIGENVWIAANCVICGGVVIQSGVVVAAGSVVTRGILQANCLYGGVPAVFIKRLD